MKIEIESRHSDYGADAGGYSVLRIDGVWIGRVEGPKARVKVEELAAKLTNEWTLINDNNLPKVGDEVLEVWTNKDRQVLTVATYDWDAGQQYLDTVLVRVYRRPLNAPAKQSATNDLKRDTMEQERAPNAS